MWFQSTKMYVQFRTKWKIFRLFHWKFIFNAKFIKFLFRRFPNLMDDNFVFLSLHKTEWQICIILSRDRFNLCIWLLPSQQPKRTNKSIWPTVSIGHCHLHLHRPSSSSLSSALNHFSQSPKAHISTIRFQLSDLFFSSPFSFSHLSSSNCGFGGFNDYRIAVVLQNKIKCQVGKKECRRKINSKKMK